MSARENADLANRYGVGKCTCGKVRYLTKKAAKTAVRRLQHRETGRTGRLHAYRCDAGFWHIGHLPKDVSTGVITRDQIFAPLPRKRSS